MITSLKEYIQHIKSTINRIKHGDFALKSYEKLNYPLDFLNLITRSSNTERKNLLKYLNKTLQFIDNELEKYANNEVEPFLEKISIFGRRHVLLLTCIKNYYIYEVKCNKEYSENLLHNLQEVSGSLKSSFDFKEMQLFLTENLNIINKDIETYTKRIQILNKALNMWKFNEIKSFKDETITVQKQLNILNNAFTKLDKIDVAIRELEDNSIDNLFINMASKADKILERITNTLQGILNHIEKTKCNPVMLKKKDYLKYKKYLLDIKKTYKEILPKYLQGEINMLLGHLTFYFLKQHNKKISLEKNYQISFAHYINALMNVSSKTDCAFLESRNSACLYDCLPENLGKGKGHADYNFHHYTVSRLKRRKGKINLEKEEAGLHIQVLVKAFKNISKVYSSSLTAKSAYYASDFKKYREQVEKKFKELIVKRKIGAMYITEILRREKYNRKEKTIFDEMLLANTFCSIGQIINPLLAYMQLHTSDKYPSDKYTSDALNCENKGKYLKDKDKDNGSSLAKNKLQTKF